MATALFEVDLTGGATTRAWHAAAGGLDRFADWSSLAPQDYDPDLVVRARIGWTENAFNEFTTLAVMGQIVSALTQAGAPLDLIGLASTFLVDEAVHVELCGRVAMALGGGVPLAYDPDDLVLPLEPGLSAIQRANELMVRVCCVGESFSLPMLAGSMRAATHPVTRAVLTRIVKDEAPHGSLGWAWLELVRDQLDDAERRRLSHAAREAIAPLSEFWERLGPRHLRVNDGEAGHALGWMEPDAYAALAVRSLREEVVERLAGFGIDVG